MTEEGRAGKNRLQKCAATDWAAEGKTKWRQQTLW